MSARRPTDPPERGFLNSSSVDDLARGLVALMREVWVLTDRQMVLEAVLQSHGVTADAIDRHQPDALLAARLDARREALIERVLGAVGAGMDSED